MYKLKRFQDAERYAFICCVRGLHDWMFKIGNGVTIDLKEDGELSAFAKDAQFMYWNNHGSLKLEIKRCGKRSSGVAVHIGPEPTLNTIERLKQPMKKVKMKPTVRYYLDEIFYYPSQIWSSEIWPWNQRFSREFMLQSRIDAVRENAIFVKDKVKGEAAINHTKHAEVALENMEFERAWRNLLYGERLILEGRDQKFLYARAVGLKAEAKLRLPEKEKEVVWNLLPDVDSGASQQEGLKERILEANDIFEKQILFLNDTRERLSGRLTLLSTILVLLIVVFGYYYTQNTPKLSTLFEFSTNSIVPVGPEIVFASFLFGGIGACLSAILSYTNLGKVPGAFEGWMLTAARPIVGATSGVVGIMIVNASLVKFENGAAIGLMSFVFGFSERLIVGAVERLEAAQET